uniref:Mitochondrial heat shock 22kDa protein, putative; 60724-61031 n=1 Tax=Arabidopsis thaliana TaxID=3702 RepID=Q9FWJ7_ARATH|nr:mitochondrial heat shock 22kDa protein precursor, putative; 60724-61031 [Arabidopsis thaliana]
MVSIGPQVRGPGPFRDVAGRSSTESDGPVHGDPLLSATRGIGASGARRGWDIKVVWECVEIELSD